MHPLLNEVARAIRDQSLLRRGERVVVAVSGGLDSMVLLHLLEALAKRQDWHLVVAHFNHGLRGRESGLDQRAVRREAERRGLPFHCGKANTRLRAKTENMSLEMAARQLRHRFLAETAKEVEATSVALAHHADDQVELFFLRLLRGAGPEGLRGMPWRNRSPANPAVRLIRPLLGHSREQLARFAGEFSIVFRSDHSNRDLGFQRNRVRHELLPLLRRNYQPALRDVILRQMEILGGENRFLAAEADAWLKNPGTPFANLPIALQRRIVLRRLQQMSIPQNFDLIEGLLLGPGRPVAVDPTRAVCLHHDGTLASIPTDDTAGVFDEGASAIELRSTSGTVQFESVRVRWRLTRGTGEGIPRRPHTEWFDADRVGAVVRLRHWRRGDRFQPTGIPAPVKLQDLFTNLKIPRRRRHELLVGETQSGLIWWVEGLRIAEHFKVTSTTRRRLRWQWERVR